MTALASYFEERVDVSRDPLSLGVGLAREAGGPFVLYERGEQWMFGSGMILELAMYQHEIQVRSSSGLLTVPTEDDPLQRVAELLSDVPISQWRAYGWASFELSYLLHGLPYAVGTAPLLHLIVPEREVRVGV